jgi:hypothetical protein
MVLSHVWYPGYETTKQIIVSERKVRFKKRKKEERKKERTAGT